jgi:hypothetical protein
MKISFISRGLKSSDLGPDDEIMSPRRIFPGGAIWMKSDNTG